MCCAEQRRPAVGLYHVSSQKAHVQILTKEDVTDDIEEDIEEDTDIDAKEDAKDDAKDDAKE